MREIKFRFWNKRDKCWEDGLLKTSPYYQNPFLRDDLIPCQYTGLKDKDGKEIYEGDIVKSYVIREQIIEVKFINGSFYPFTNGIDFRIESQDVEVIGNIYENPELLEDKNEVVKK